ncbi:MAG TPA: hypothetical protein PLV68_04405, partial [Ilumatobacteraceae bacterium]|nr:hypothetical protein [Ilumatobacteraceae bacterium]
MSLTAGVPVPITVIYRNPGGVGQFNLYQSKSTGTNFARIPSSWLTTAARVLPRGWVFNHSEVNGALYSSARADADSIVVTYTDGSTGTFTRNASGVFVDPEGDGAQAVLSAGVITVTDEAGYAHVFNNDGTLKTVTAPIDVRVNATATPTWTSWTPSGLTQAASRLTAMTDPASGRQVTYHYQGVSGSSCPSVPGGFVAPFEGMLCKVGYPDGTVTNLYYTSAAG